MSIFLLGRCGGSLPTISGHNGKTYHQHMMLLGKLGDILVALGLSV